MQGTIQVLLLKLELFEAFFVELVKDLGGNCKGGDCREVFIDKNLPQMKEDKNEIKNYNNLLEAIVDILHSKGSHSKIADEEIFYFRLLLILAWTFYTLHIRDKIKEG